MHVLEIVSAIVYLYTLLAITVSFNRPENKQLGHAVNALPSSTATARNRLPEIYALVVRSTEGLD